MVGGVRAVLLCAGLIHSKQQMHVHGEASTTAWAGGGFGRPGPTRASCRTATCLPSHVVVGAGALRHVAESPRRDTCMQAGDTEPLTYPHSPTAPMAPSQVPPRTHQPSAHSLTHTHETHMLPAESVFRLPLR